MSSYSLHIKGKDVEDGVYTLSLSLSKSLSNKEHNYEIAKFIAIYDSNATHDDKIKVDTDYISDMTILDKQDVAQFMGYSLSDFIKFQLYGYNEAHPKTYYYNSKYSERIRMCALSYMGSDDND